MNIAEKLPNLKGTILIVTYGRSGSTLLQSMLQTIPGAYISGENYNAMYSVFEAGKRARRAKRTWGKKPQPIDHPWHGADTIAPLRFEQRMADAFINEVLKPPKEATWMGFKEIRYPQCDNDFESFLKFMGRVFPNAFFVFNSRDGEDVAQSKWWANQPKDQVLAKVREMDEKFADFATNNPNSSHHVIFEDLVADPVSLQPLFDKLAEPFDLKRAQHILGKQLTH